MQLHIAYGLCVVPSLPYKTNRIARIPKGVYTKSMTWMLLIVMGSEVKWDWKKTE